MRGKVFVATMAMKCRRIAQHLAADFSPTPRDSSFTRRRGTAAQVSKKIWCPTVSQNFRSPPPPQPLQTPSIHLTPSRCTAAHRHRHHYPAAANNLGSSQTCRPLLIATDGADRPAAHDPRRRHRLLRPTGWSAALCQRNPRPPLPLPDSLPCRPRSQLGCWLQ